jgi:hypothetical protein
MRGTESRQAICAEMSQTDAAVNKDELLEIFIFNLSKAWRHNESGMRMISVRLKDITNNVLCHS